MTAHPRSSSLPALAETVEWRELQRVEPHGMGREPRPLPRPRVQYLHETWQLPGNSPRTPREAREHVVSSCRVWRVPHRIVDDLAVIVSELATNAILHAPGETVSVAVVLTTYDVRVAVVDHGPRRPIEAHQAPDAAEHGRGLFLVEALASRCETQPVGDGTVVWACIPLPDPHTLRTDTPTEETPDAPRSHI